MPESTLTSPQIRIVVLQNESSKNGKMLNKEYFLKNMAPEIYTTKETK